MMKWPWSKATNVPEKPEIILCFKCLEPTPRGRLDDDYAYCRKCSRADYLLLNRPRTVAEWRAERDALLATYPDAGRADQEGDK